MYILIEKEPFKVTTFETKSDLSGYIGVHRNTIANRFDKDEFWECEKGTVYQSTTHYKRDRRGNRDDKETKLRKRNREIPCNDPKLNKGYTD